MKRVLAVENENKYPCPLARELINADGMDDATRKDEPLQENDARVRAGPFQVAAAPRDGAARARQAPRGGPGRHARVEDRALVEGPIGAAAAHPRCVTVGRRGRAVRFPRHARRLSHAFHHGGEFLRAILHRRSMHEHLSRRPGIDLVTARRASRPSRVARPFAGAREEDRRRRPRVRR